MPQLAECLPNTQATLCSILALHKPVVVGKVCSPCTWEAEACGSVVTPGPALGHKPTDRQHTGTTKGEERREDRRCTYVSVAGENRTEW